MLFRNRIGIISSLTPDETIPGLLAIQARHGYEVYDFRACEASNAGRFGGGTPYYPLARTKIAFLCSEIDELYPLKWRERFVHEKLMLKLLRTEITESGV
jgi:hypothetical protein